MSLIKVNTQLIREGAHRLQHARAENDNAISILNGIIDGLVADWHGEAQDSFANSYARKKKIFSQFSSDIDALAMALNRFADAVESQEQLEITITYGLQ